MTHATTIRAGQRLSTTTGVAFCRLGAVVVGGDGRLLGLTARHILECEGDGRLFDAETNALIGTAVAGRAQVESGGDFAETIGIIELAHVSIDDSDVRTANLTSGTPRFRNGERVTKRQSDCANIDGSLEGFGGSIEFEDPTTGHPTILRGVIELSFPDDVGATQRGEAGSPVFDGTGALIGLLMAGSAERAYAAPVHEFLERHGYRLYCAEPESAVQEGTADAGIKLELRSAAFGATRLRRDINAAPGAGRDPYTEVVPTKLLEMLGQD
jgi:hypothetical protein